MIATRTPLLLPACAGLLGAAGIAVSAAAAHHGGSGTAATAGTFLLVHGATVFALSALQAGTGSVRYAVAAAALTLGSVLFSGDLALAGLFDSRPFPPAAPLGGLLLIGGWLTVPVWSLAVLLRGRRR